MLSERQMLVLKAIVEEYVRTNEPVGSRTLSKRTELAFSPATLRNDMADLEDLGFLEKTHTSSGRIPSESGYRFYVEQILVEKEKNGLTFPMIDRIFEKSNLSRSEAVAESMALVADLTNYATVTMGQSARNSRIKKLEFVALHERFACILLVTDQGHVESKRIIVPEGLSVKEIERTVQILDEVLNGTLVCEISEKIKSEIKNETLNDYLSYREDLLNAFVNAFSDMVKDSVFVAGQSNILSLPEFKDAERARALFEVIENKEILKIIKADNSGITIRIGQENEIKAMQNCTIITVPYEGSTGEKGAISIIGPTRMEYNKVIPILEYIARHVKKIV